MKKILENKYVRLSLTLIVGLVLGWLIKPSGEGTSLSPEAQATAENEVWTCSMHPQIRKSKPGQCPLCGMDLILVSNDSDNSNPMAIRMSPTAMQLADVRTARVEKKQPVKVIRLSGKVQPDERYVFSQTSHISGRIEQLLLNYTGEYVTKGKVIAYIYSPELVTTQKELFEAFKIKDKQPGLYQASKDKLKNWKLTNAQIDKILESGTPIESFPILSDLTGVVISKKVNLGDHVNKGEPLFEVANLKKVWLLFDIYESDLNWVKKGDEVSYSLLSLPGENFKGKIDFIDPVIDPKSRVAKARITLNNDGRLKPEMLVSGTIESSLTAKKELVIPKTAVMWTGERSVVYVKTKESNGLHFQLREVLLGSSLGDYYVISSGLEEGEEIAVHGTFSIDAAAQLAGKPSMMNPDATDNSSQKILSVSIETETKKELSALYKVYFEMKDALVNDDFKGAKQAGEALKSELGSIPMVMFSGASHEVWMKSSKSLNASLEHIAHLSDINEVREVFLKISTQMIVLTEAFRPLDQTSYVQHCPMANTNQGADWLSLDKEVKNPYFGAAMLNCGEVRYILTNQ